MGRAVLNGLDACCSELGSRPFRVRPFRLRRSMPPSWPRNVSCPLPGRELRAVQAGRESLRHAGHDAVTVAEQGMAGDGDADVAAACATEGRVLVILASPSSLALSPSLLRPYNTAHSAIQAPAGPLRHLACSALCLGLCVCSPPLAPLTGNLARRVRGPTSKPPGPHGVQMSRRSKAPKSLSVSPMPRNPYCPESS